MQNPAEPEYWIVKLKNAPPPPRIDGITSIDCHSTTTLTAIQDEPVPTPVKRYEWSTGDSTQAIQVGAAAGTSTYTVTITYENRCTKVVSVQVNVTGHLSFLNPVINSAICTAHTGNIQVNVQDGVAPYSYSWNVAGTTAILPNLSTGTYTATATDANNCTGSATFVVPLQIDTVHWQQPTFTPQICNTGGSFTATPSSGTAPYTYQNSQNTTTNTLTNLVAGNYSVSATDANGCTGSTIVVITQQNPIIAANLSVAQPFCAGQTGSILCLPQGGTAPYTVLPTVLTGLNSGTYTVSVSDANGCNTTASAVVAAPLPLTISLLSQNSTCGLQNGSMTVLPQGGTAPYMVSPSILTGLPAGNYTVSVTDAHNCSVSTTTTLTATPPITADVVTTNPICYGDASGSIALNNIQNAVPPVVFSVDNGTFAPSNPIVNVTSGLHIVTLQDAANCTLSNSVTLAEGYSFSVNIGRDTALHFGDSLLLTAVLQGGNLHPPYVLTWAQDNTTVAITNTTANTTTNTNSVLIFPSFGGGFGGSLTLSVRATDTNGCIATDKLVAEIKDGNSVYLPNTITPNGDGKNDYFVIFGGVNVKTVKLLRIFDRYGELVYEKHDFAPNTPTWDGTWARYATAYVAPAWGGQGGVGFGFSKTDAAIDVYAVYTEVELMDGTIKAFIQDLTVVR
jgi:gliding motility-associated-like protein